MHASVIWNARTLKKENERVKVREENSKVQTQTFKNDPQN
jgi:hypothetical protein